MVATGVPDTKDVTRCAVPFGIFQMMANEHSLGEISLVGDQCESAVEEQGKSG